MKTIILGVIALLLSSFLSIAVEQPAVEIPPLDPLSPQVTVDVDDLQISAPEVIPPIVTGDAIKPLQAKYQQTKDTQKDSLQYYVVAYSQNDIAGSQKILQKELHLIGYIPYHQYIAKATETQLKQSQDKGIVDSYILYRDWNKGYAVAENGETLYYVYAFPDADLKTLENQLYSLDVPLLDRQEQVFVIDLKDVVDADAVLQRVLQIEGVEAVEPRPHYALLNDKTNIVVGVADLRKRSLLFGEGQIIAIADTGLDTGKNDQSMHLDFSRTDCELARFSL